MATVNFLYRSTKNKGNLSLRLLYRLNEIDHVYSANTKLEIEKEYWTKQHKKKSKDISITNKQLYVSNELNKIENFILNSFRSIDPQSVNKLWLQSEVNKFYNPVQEEESVTTELIKYIDVYVEHKRRELANSTITKFNGIKQLLSRYQIYSGRIIKLNEVNLSFKRDFENYCELKSYAPNTIARALRFIKTFCKHAHENGLEINFQLNSIKTKNSKVENIYLSFDEILQIKKCKLSESLENARDWLIISCYTGQRVSDFMRFNKSMIRNEKNVKKNSIESFIEFTQKKTGKNMTVPLNQEVLEILRKRNGEFPYIISDQKYNVHIKEICKIAGLNQKINGGKSVKISVNNNEIIKRKQYSEFEKWELVTSHIGRRSFASNYYGLVPTTYLIYITGHSTESMFLNYIGKSNKDLAMEMSNFFNDI